MLQILLQHWRLLMRYAIAYDQVLMVCMSGKGKCIDNLITPFSVAGHWSGLVLKSYLSIQGQASTSRPGSNMVPFGFVDLISLIITDFHTTNFPSLECFCLSLFRRLRGWGASMASSTLCLSIRWLCTNTPTQRLTSSHCSWSRSSELSSTGMSSPANAASSKLSMTPSKLHGWLFVCLVS